MRKNIKKSLMIILGVMVFCVTPTFVSAAEFDWGKKTNDGNITKIPVKLIINENESINQIVLGCRTDNTEVSCEIVPVTDNGTSSIDSGSSKVITYIGTDESSNFPVGELVVADVVLTNESASKITNLEVSLKNASIGGTSKSLSIKTEVNAKEVEKEKSNDARLKDIKFSQGTMSPAFNPDVTEYTVYGIADTINSVRITPTCYEGECDFSISGGKSVNGMTVTLNQGKNTVEVEITSESGEQSLTYTFTVIRGETGYNSAKLGSLSFGDYVLTPAFSPDVLEYTISVPNQVNGLINILKYAAQDENATVNVSGIDNLVEGINTLTITVDSVSGDATNTYKITVNRLSVANIVVTMYFKGEITFKDSDGIATTLTEDEFKKQYPEEYAKIKDGTYKFDKNGNIITNEPVEEEPTENKEEKKNNKIWLIVGLIVVGLIIIIVSGILIFKKKDPVEEKKEETEDNVSDNTMEINEDGVEEAIVGEKFSSSLDSTVDIDDALSDLMSTKQYDFSEDLKDK